MIRISDNDTVAKLRDFINKNTGISPENMNITYAGKPLSMDRPERKLYEYDIQDNSNLMLLFRQNGGI